MESFTIELVSNASAQLFPYKTQSSFTNFSSEQLNLEGQWEFAILELPYPLMYQNVTHFRNVSYFSQNDAIQFRLRPNKEFS